MARLTPHQLIRPHGPLTTRLFPGLSTRDLEILAETWLARAYEHDAIAGEDEERRQNRMARAYALYLAFDEGPTIDRNADPLSVTVAEKGGHSYSRDQLLFFERRAARYLVEFNELIPSATAGPTPGTATIPVRLAW